MKSLFTNQFFVNNRNRLRLVAGDKLPIVIAANGLMQRAGDTFYPFSQDANFWYLTGIDTPDVVLVMDSDSEYLIIPNRSSVRETFDGAILSSSLSKRSGIKEILGYEEGWQKLKDTLSKTRYVSSVAPLSPYFEHYGFYTNPARASLTKRLEKKVKIIGDISKELAHLRMVKQSLEIKAITKAIDITLSSLKEAFEPKKVANYKYEFEIEAEIRAGFRRRGASGDAFEPIVAGGKNACTLHNISNNSPLSKKNMVLCDVGAEVEHYSADITRVYSLSRASKRQLEVVKAVQEVQAYALAMLKPGLSLKDYEQNIEYFMGQQLIKLKLIKQASTINIRKYCPHSTSHFLGLNVHDNGDYNMPLTPGVVLTCEPGIYIPEESIGVRIEDDVLITETGHKVLSAELTEESS